MSQHFPLIAPPAPIAHVCDVNDMGDTDDPLGVQSEFNSDTNDRKVTLVYDSTELIDFSVPDQPREMRIGSSILLMRGVDSLTCSGHTWMYLHGRMRTCQALTQP